jgi:hypothetical protein
MPLTNDRILIVRETRTHRAVGAMRRQVSGYDAREVILDLLGGRSERFTLTYSSATSHHSSHPSQRTYLLEVRKQVFPAPTGVTQPLLGVIIGRRTSGEEHAIDDSTAADYGTRVEHAGPIVQTGLRDTCISSHILARDRKARRCSAVFLAVAMLH